MIVKKKTPHVTKAVKALSGQKFGGGPKGSQMEDYPMNYGETPKAQQSRVFAGILGVFQDQSASFEMQTARLAEVLMRLDGFGNPPDADKGLVTSTSVIAQLHTIEEKNYDTINRIAELLNRLEEIV